MLNSQHSAVIDEPGSHKQLPKVLHLKAIIASHHGITIQSNDQLQVLRILHLSLRLQNPVKDPVRNPEKGHFFVVSFDRVLDLTIIEQEFTMDKDFWAESYFADSYGILRREDVPVQRVVIRAFGHEPYYLRDLPLHSSQTELASGDGYTDFEYRFRVSADFYPALLAKGPNIQVLEPEWLVDEIKLRIEHMNNLYR